MTAKDYPVNFGYGAQDGYYYGPNGIVGPFHRGNDRPTPTGTPIVIAGTRIGLTGATGLVGGPHLHTQAGTDQACQNTFDPTPLDFKPGKVVAAATGTQWGKYITIQVGGQFITYAHLSVIDVSVGQVLSGGSMPNKYVLRKIAGEIEGFSKEVYDGVNDDQLVKAWGDKPTEDYVNYAWDAQKVKRHELVRQIGDLQKRVKELEAEQDYEAYQGPQLFKKKGT